MRQKRYSRHALKTETLGYFFNVIVRFSLITLILQPLNSFGIDPKQLFVDPDRPTSNRQVVCPQFITCSNNGKTPEWARERVGSDLAEIEMKRIGIDASTVKVAIIDTGFDLNTYGRQIPAAGLEVRAAYTSQERSRIQGMAASALRVPWEKLLKEAFFQLDIGDPAEDRRGHGTMVLSQIASPEGTGLALKPFITSYKVVNNNEISLADAIMGSTTHETLKIAIRRACDEGHELINVSWGSSNDEDGDQSGRTRDEVIDQAFIQGLHKDGCIVFKAAGNSGVRKHYATDSLDDAYLRVGAISSFGGYAEFSSLGEVTAPGAEVYALESTNIPSYQRAENIKRCNGRSGVFINGTSFSAPITMALGANILATFKSTSKFRALKPQDRVTLFNRTLKASEVFGTINAYRGVLIAEAWGKLQSPTIMAVEQLRRLLPQINCAQPSNNCESSTTCDGRTNCFNSKRARGFLCGEKYAPGEIEDLINIAISSGHREFAGTWLFANPEKLQIALKYSPDRRATLLRVLQTVSDGTYSDFIGIESLLSAALDEDLLDNTIASAALKFVLMSDSPFSDRQIWLSKVMTKYPITKYGYVYTDILDSIRSRPKIFLDPVANSATASFNVGRTEYFVGSELKYPSRILSILAKNPSWLKEPNKIFDNFKALTVQNPILLTTYAPIVVQSRLSNSALRLDFSGVNLSENAAIQSIFEGFEEFTKYAIIYEKELSVIDEILLEMLQRDPNNFQLRQAILKFLGDLKRWESLTGNLNLNQTQVSLVQELFKNLNFDFSNYINFVTSLGQQGYISKDLSISIFNRTDITRSNFLNVFILLTNCQTACPAPAAAYRRFTEALQVSADNSFPPNIVFNAFIRLELTAEQVDTALAFMVKVDSTGSNSYIRSIWQNLSSDPLQINARQARLILERLISNQYLDAFSLGYAISIFENVKPRPPAFSKLLLRGLNHVSNDQLAIYFGGLQFHG